MIFCGLPLTSELMRLKHTLPPVLAARSAWYPLRSARQWNTSGRRARAGAGSESCLQQTVALVCSPLPGGRTLSPATWTKRRLCRIACERMRTWLFTTAITRLQVQSRSCLIRKAVVPAACSAKSGAASSGVQVAAPDTDGIPQSSAQPQTVDRGQRSSPRAAGADAAAHFCQEQPTPEVQRVSTSAALSTDASVSRCRCLASLVLCNISLSAQGL